MENVRTPNLALSFLLELGALAAVAWWGFNLAGHPWTRVVAGIGAPLGIPLLWGALLAPKSSRRLDAPWLIVVKSGVFGGAALALYGAGHATLAAVFAAGAAINLVLEGSFGSTR